MVVIYLPDSVYCHSGVVCCSEDFRSLPLEKVPVGEMPNCLSLASIYIHHVSHQPIGKFFELLFVDCRLWVFPKPVGLGAWLPQHGIIGPFTKEKNIFKNFYDDQ
jgi:hypothetical protein